MIIFYNNNNIFWNFFCSWYFLDWNTMHRCIYTRKSRQLFYQIVISLEINFMKLLKTTVKSQFKFSWEIIKFYIISDSIGKFSAITYFNSLLLSYFASCDGREVNSDDWEKPVKRANHDTAVPHRLGVFTGGITRRHVSDQTQHAVVEAAT